MVPIKLKPIIQIRICTAYIGCVQKANKIIELCIMNDSLKLIYHSHVAFSFFFYASTDKCLQSVYLSHTRCIKMNNQNSDMKTKSISACQRLVHKNDIGSPCDFRTIAFVKMTDGDEYDVSMYHLMIFV